MSLPWTSPTRAPYDSRILTYIDILGWKELVNESVAKPELVSELEEALKVPESLMAGFGAQSGVQVSQFSDHVCISVVGVPGTPLQVRGACTFAKVIAENVMKLGFCVRGAIVNGPLVHRGARIFGPALLEAHYIESQVAKYPRIVLSPGIAAVVSIGGNMGHSKDFALKDTDGLSYLNVIDGQNVPARCRAIGTAVQRRMPPKPSLDVQAKRDWLLGYLSTRETTS